MVDKTPPEVEPQLRQEFFRISSWEASCCEGFLSFLKNHNWRIRSLCALWLQELLKAVDTPPEVLHRLPIRQRAMGGRPYSSGCSPTCPSPRWPARFIFDGWCTFHIPSAFGHDNEEWCSRIITSVALFQNVLSAVALPPSKGCIPLQASYFMHQQNLFSNWSVL